MLNKPMYHFAPAKNWMNDPNGTVYRNGTYHLFYQYNPEGSSWGNICWAYATSPDLINWQRKGIRLRPETQKGERYCFSGCALPQGDGYLMAYTSIGFEEWAIQQHARQRFARANADFTHIERLYDRDLDERSQPFAVQEWRDPFIFSYLGAHYLLLCGVVWKNGKAENNVLLYRATDKDCTAWEYASTLFTDPDRVIECPNMLIQNGKAALLYSTIGDRNVKYVAGDFDGTRLWERRRGAVDWSQKCFYATNLSQCAEGGNVLYGWLQEDLKEGDSPDGERSGCLAIPRSIRIDDEYRLHFAPVPQLRSLQGEALGAVNNEIAGGGVRARLQFTTRGECRLHITESERERITVRVRDGEVI
ncbi:MAG: glycoside hydrolase family 32 protein, partial [Clostridiales bacterium]|nr:glycoside hydrolase family 32 protein [Clostridiales bacterium]